MGSPRAFSDSSSRQILSIGVSRYQDPLWQPLKYPLKDARDVFQAFTEDFGFQGLVVANPSLGSKKNLLTMLHRFQTTVKEDGVALIYLSGHGSLAKTKRGVERFFVPSDAVAGDLATTGIATRDLLQWFQDLPAKKKVLILAFCYSGIGKSAVSELTQKELAQYKAPLPSLFAVSEGALVLTASAPQEPARESSRLQNDIYTHFLLEGTGKDQNGDGLYTLSEAHQFAVKKTFSYTKGEQRPSALMQWQGWTPIVLKGDRSKEPEAILFSFAQGIQDYFIAINGGPPEALEKGLRLPEGRVYLEVHHKKKDALLAQHVRVEKGRAYELTQLLQKNGSYQVSGFVAYDRKLSRGSTFGVMVEKEEWLAGLDGLVSMAFSTPFPQETGVGEYRVREMRQVVVGKGALSYPFFSHRLRRGQWSGSLYGGGQGVYLSRRYAASDSLRSHSKSLHGGFMAGMALSLALVDSGYFIRGFFEGNVLHRSLETPYLSYWGSGIGMGVRF